MKGRSQFEYYHLENKRIAIDEGMSQLQTLKTAIHEIAHAKLHDIDLNAPTQIVLFTVSYVTIYVNSPSLRETVLVPFSSTICSSSVVPLSAAKATVFNEKSIESAKRILIIFFIVIRPFFNCP
mgnify:CR=1 FL=1